MRRRKRADLSRSRWIAAMAIALLAAFAWKAFRGPEHDASTAPAETTAPVERTTQALALPPIANEPSPSPATRYPDFLPAEAIDTLRLIERGGPYPYRQDDGVFGNRERRLPSRSRGYYREYTVKTPGSRDRGARRIVTGGHPPTEYFYTDDHYDSFRRFTLDGDGQGTERR